MTTTTTISRLRAVFGRSTRSFTGAALCALLLAVAPTAVRAQGTGSITGSVADGATGKYLEGADVSVDGTSLRTATAREGAFSIANVPAGTRTLIVSYPGLEPKSVAVPVTSGQASSTAIRLGASEVIKLAEFKVAGTKEGMAQAIALQKVAINTKIVAAGDQYGDIAEGNAAEYLKFSPASASTTTPTTPAPPRCAA
jgi:hypothetical protein